MFTNKKTVLFITKSKITVSQVTIDNKPNENILGQFDWTPYVLDDVLLRIKRLIGSNIRILLSEDFVYVVDITLPPSSIVNKDLVRQKAQELIPENLRETAWDFKEIAKTLQVVAVVKSLFECLSKSLGKADFRVEAIEPLSYALARFTKRKDNPFLFVYVDTEILFTLAQKETVITTQRLSVLTPTNINQFIAFAKEKFFVEPKNVVFCGNTKNIDLKQYKNPNFKAEMQNISPAISVAYKEDIKGKDEDVLNLGLLKILSFDNQVQPTNNNISPIKTKDNSPNKTRPQPQQKRFPYAMIIAIGFIVTIGVALGLIAYKNISSKKPEFSKSSKSTFTPRPTPTFTLTPLATQSAEIDISAYTISMLNGTGKAGEATKLETLLKDEGFNVVKTGNAERFDYEKTEVHYKETVPSELILLLDKSLKTLYDFSIARKLEDKEDTDVLIIIGKSVKE